MDEEAYQRDKAAVKAVFDRHVAPFEDQVDKDVATAATVEVGMGPPSSLLPRRTHTNNQFAR